MKIIALAILLLAVAGLSCGPSAHQISTDAIVAVGGVTAVIQSNHQRVYVEATDALRSRLVTTRGTIADYDAQVIPLNRVFEDRGHAIQDLDASLYEAAAIIDAARGSRSQEYAIVARHTLDVIERTLLVLEDGSVLPAVPIPPEVHDAIALLQAIVGASMGASVRGAGHAH